jgi:cytochrome P450
MACALFQLANQPELAKRLREALEPHVSQSPDAEIFDDQISTIELLDGVISESLRLYPPSPSHPTRVTPPEGATIAGRFVPGGTQVMAPQYVIGRGKWFFYLEATGYIFC